MCLIFKKIHSLQHQIIPDILSHFNLPERRDFLGPGPRSDRDVTGGFQFTVLKKTEKNARIFFLDISVN